MISSPLVKVANKNIMTLRQRLQDSDPEKSYTIEFLLACIKIQLGTLSPKNIKIPDHIDWEYLLKIAQQHGMLPILYNVLQTNLSNTNHQTVLTWLRRQAAQIAKRNLLLTSELINLLNWLDTHNIAAVPFKGPVLAKTAYSNLSLRQFIDLDILIHKKDASKIKQLMLADGYEQVFHVAVNAAYEAFHLQTACEYTFLSQVRKVTVEPHWGFTQKKLCISFNSEHLWQRLQQVSIAGKTLPAFPPEDTMLIVCINGMKDHWCNFKTICDVAALLCNCQIDWEVLMQRSRRAGCQRILFVGLNLAYSTLDAPVPDHILQQVQADHMAQLLTAQVHSRLFEKITKRRGDQIGGSFSIWDLQIRERKRDKIHYLFSLIFSPNEKDALIVPLPPSLYWVYSFLRPFRLIMRFMLRASK